MPYVLNRKIKAINFSNKTGKGTRTNIWYFIPKNKDTMIYITISILSVVYILSNQLSVQIMPAKIASNSFLHPLL